MTIDANSLSLAQYATMSNNPMVRAVTMSLIDYGNVLQDVPLQNKKSMIANGVRFEGNLPTVNWAPVNSEGKTTVGTPTAYAEQLYLIRNYIDVDKMYVEDENAITDPREAQINAYLKSVTYDFNDKFFNNDHITGDINSFVGLKFRINNGSTFGVRPENSIAAGGVGVGIDVSQAGATQATANKFLETLDQLLWSVDSPDGNGVVIYMNEVMKRRFPFLVRLMGTAGGYEITTDQFDRTIEKYKGAVIRDPGYKKDQTTRIISNVQDVNGNEASSTYTSIYAVNYGYDHFFGWQFEDINVEDLGKIYNGVIYRTFIDWAIGLMNQSTRSIGRIYGLKTA